MLKLSKLFLSNQKNHGMKKQKLEQPEFKIVDSEVLDCPGSYFYIEATGMETS